jgi:hypothetical protein
MSAKKRTRRQRHSYSPELVDLIWSGAQQTLLATL